MLISCGELSFDFKFISVNLITSRLLPNFSNLLVVVHHIFLLLN